MSVPITIAIRSNAVCILYPVNTFEISQIASSFYPCTPKIFSVWFTDYRTSIYYIVDIFPIGQRSLAFVGGDFPQQSPRCHLHAGYLFRFRQLRFTSFDRKGQSAYPLLDLLIRGQFLRSIQMQVFQLLRWIISCRQIIFRMVCAFIVFPGQMVVYSREIHGVLVLHI